MYMMLSMSPEFNTTVKRHIAHITSVRRAAYVLVEMRCELLFPFEGSIAELTLVFLQILVDVFFVFNAVNGTSERTPAIPTRLGVCSSLQRR